MCEICTRGRCHISDYSSMQSSGAVLSLPALSELGSVFREPGSLQNAPVLSRAAQNKPISRFWSGPGQMSFESSLLH